MEILRLERIRKTFFSGETVCPFSAITLTIKAGDLVSIVGPSGTGKSTLLNVMGGLLTPDSGEIYLDSKNLRELSDEALTELRAEKLGFIFQETHLIQAFTIRENLEFIQSRQYTRKVDTQLISEMIERLGLADREKHLPCQLSIGQRRRAVIASALIKRPQLILADEPTNDLDIQWAQSVMELFSEAVQKGSAVVMVTHHPEWARTADQQYRLENGHLHLMMENTPHTHQ